MYSWKRATPTESRFDLQYTFESKTTKIPFIERDIKNDKRVAKYRFSLANTRYDDKYAIRKIRYYKE